MFFLNDPCNEVIKVVALLSLLAFAFSFDAPGLPFRKVRLPHSSTSSDHFKDSMVCRILADLDPPLLSPCFVHGVLGPERRLGFVFPES